MIEEKLLRAYYELETDKFSSSQLAKAEKDGWTVNQSLPFEYMLFLDGKNINRLVGEFVQHLVAYQKHGGDSCCWEHLSSLGVDHRQLLYLFSHYIVQPASSCLSLSLQCGIAYLYMAVIRGSEFLRIFNTVLYSHVLDHIRSAYNGMITRQKIGGDVCGKRKKNSNSNNNNAKVPENNDDIPIPVHEQSDVLRSLGDFADVMISIFKNSNELNLNSECVDLSVQTLMLLGKLERKTFLADKIQDQSRRNTEAYITYKSYEVLLKLPPLILESIEDGTCFVVKRLLPTLKVESDANGSRMIHNTTIVKKNAILFFLHQLIVYYKRDSYVALEKLLQYLCYMIPERADLRSKTMPIINDVLSISPTDLLHRQIFKIILLCHVDDVKVRTFAVEILTKLLLENFQKERIPINAVFGGDGDDEDGDDKSSLGAVVNFEFITAVIVFMCRDVSANVKSKAFASLEKLIDNRFINRVLMRRIFIDPFVDCDSLEDSTEYERPIFDTQQYLCDELYLQPDPVNFLPGVKSFTDVLYHFLRVRRVYVRKSALQTLGKILLMNPKILNDRISEVLLERCSDISIMIRKSAAKVLTDIVKQFSDDQSVAQLWVKGVIPLCAEEDSKHQDKILTDFIFPVLFLNLTSFEHTKTALTILPWNVMKEILTQSKGYYLTHIIYKWCTMPQAVVKDKTVENIYTHVDTRNDACAWFIISSLAKIKDLPQPTFIYEKFVRMFGNLNVDHSHFVMEALCGVFSQLDRNVQLTLSHRLKKCLMEGELPSKLISLACDICQLVASFNLEGDAKKNAIIGWSQPLLDSCECWLLNHANIAKQQIINPQKTARYIMLLGEIGNLRSKELSFSVREILETFLLPPTIDDVQICNEQLTDYIRPTITLCLTKLCMGDERYLPRILPRYKKILTNDDESCNLKLNVIHSFCDLSSRHTSKVEPYLVDICGCFYSPFEELRIAALRAIIQNLKECYIKVKPWFVHPLFMMMLDESPEVIAILNSFLNGDLKHSIFEQFSGFLYYANDYREADDTWPKNLPIPPAVIDDANKRKMLYLKIVDSVPGLSHRIHIWQKINVDVIGKVVEGIVPFGSDKTIAVLSDAFFVLSENERFIREQTSKSNEDEDLIEEEYAEREQSTELNTAQIVNMRMPLLLTVVRYLLAIVKRIQSRREIYEYYIKYITEMKKNFAENCQEIEPLYNAVSDEAEIGGRPSTSSAVSP